jgi:hypothetical protein
MKKISQTLEKGVFEIIRSIETQLNQDVSIQVFVAGGVAVNYYAGIRSTRDLDLFFSHPILPDWKRMVATLDDNQILYADPNYNPGFGLLHPDFEEAAVLWEGFQSIQLKLKLLSPLDLAVSKLSRFSDIDRGDIIALGGYFTARDFEVRVQESLKYYVGSTQWIQKDLEEICLALNSKK